MKAFEKVSLKPSERCTVTFHVPVDDLGFYDGEAGEWVTKSGAFELLVGSSSRDICLTERFEVH
ncbi:fibronectin type III-like domain-contianing protein [Halalkalicoccus jeotgali]|uniref:fibronectin type III-like domain-contianing protein n=1 Tax=Halalkalicoccus jeotgali TaxID=413810 RepID=UPI0009DA6F76